MEMELLHPKKVPTPSTANQWINNLNAVEGVWEYVSFLVKSFHQVRLFFSKFIFFCKLNKQETLHSYYKRTAELPT